MPSGSNRIVEKRVLGPSIKMFVVETPRIARKSKPGQFLVVRVDERGERIPLTIADSDAEKGIITLVIQEVGKSTIRMGVLREGDTLLDLVGPLGKPSHIDYVGKVVLVGGGIGIAPIYPVVKAMKYAGNSVVSIIGARTKELLFWEDKVKEFSDELLVTTDDGSCGHKGFVTDAVREVVSREPQVDLVVAIGPVIMMKAVAEVTRGPAIQTIVSLNPIMVDATGMCGGCRVTVGDRTKFACVDGPEFDGHLVDFDELMRRRKMYVDEEKTALQKCRLNHVATQHTFRAEHKG